MSVLSNLVAPTFKRHSSSAPLALGILLDSFEVPYWIHYVIEKLTRCKAIEASTFILTNHSRVAIGADRGPVLFRAWDAFDRKVRRPRTDALRLRDCRLLLRRARPIPVLSHGVDIAALNEARLDLLLYLGCGVPAAEISASAGLRTWSVQPCSLSGMGPVPGQFWDMYERNRVTQYGPQLIEQKQNQTRVVYRSSTITNFLSLALNQNAAAWEMAQFLVTQLSNAEQLETSVQLPSRSDAAISPTLGNLRMAGFLVQWFARILRNEFKKRFLREQWSIALQAKGDMPKVNAEQGFKILRPPRDRFYADPFVIDRDGRSFLFFEDYRFATKKGLISCCEVDAMGNCSEPRVVLERNYHLSYPFLFTWQGEIYMIPETRDNRTIEMYRASAFPYSWVYETVLMPDVSATDSTLLHYRNKWWLFTAGVLDHTSPNETLFLFFANSPLGPWTAHPQNPIVSDGRHARPAGCLYFDDGQLIRPGQDCSDGYGYAAQLHRVDVLTETEYQETLVTSITPDWIRGSRGIHTFNQNAELRVLDCKFLISRFGRSKPQPHNSFGHVSVRDSR